MFSLNQRYKQNELSSIQISISKQPFFRKHKYYKTTLRVNMSYKSRQLINNSNLW